MGKSVTSTLPTERLLWEEASEVFDVDLLRACELGPKSSLEATKVCQPATVVTSLAALVLFNHDNPRVRSSPDIHILYTSTDCIHLVSNSTSLYPHLVPRLPFSSLFSSALHSSMQLFVCRCSAGYQVVCGHRGLQCGRVRRASICRPPELLGQYGLFVYVIQLYYE